MLSFKMKKIYSLQEIYWGNHNLMTIFVKHPKPDLGLAMEQVDRFQTPTGSLFIESVKEGFRLNPVPSAMRYFQFQDKGVSPDYAAINRRAFVTGARTYQPITEDEFKESRHFREGIKYNPTLTMEQAEILARRHDRRKKRDFIFQHSRPGIGNIITSFTGGIIGSIPDPTNFIPIFGQAGRVYAVNRLGKTLGRAALNSLEAGIVVGASQPIILAAERLEQSDYDFKAAALSVSFAFGIGGGFGAIMGRLAKVPLEVRVAGVAKAIDDITTGKPVDLNDTIKPYVEKATIGDIIRTHISSEENIRTRVVADSGDTIFGKAVQHIQETQLRDLTVADIIDAIIMPKFMRSRLNQLVSDKIEDIGELRTILNLAEKKTLLPEERILLDAFKKSDTDYFNEIITRSSKKIDKLDNEIKSTKDSLDNLRKKTSLRKVTTAAERKELLALDKEIKEIERLPKRERGDKVSKLKQRASTIEIKAHIDKQREISNRETKLVNLMDERRIDNFRKLNAENRIKQISGKQPELRFDTAKVSDEIVEAPKRKPDKIFKDLDAIDDAAIDDVRNQANRLKDDENMESLFRKIEEIELEEGKLPALTRLYNELIDCIVKE